MTFSPITDGGKRGLRARPLTDATGSVCLLRILGRVKIAHFTSAGQTKPVHVYQLIAENTVESKVGREMEA